MNLVVEALLRQEMEKADKRYGPFHSSHEGLGVLEEERIELIAAIRANDLKAIHAEAIQVAAVALRLAESLSNPDTAERSIP